VKNSIARASSVQIAIPYTLYLIPRSEPWFWLALVGLGLVASASASASAFGSDLDNDQKSVDFLRLVFLGVCSKHSMDSVYRDLA
jgi:hypothetical protein